MTVIAPVPPTPAPRSPTRWGPGRVLGTVVAVLFLMLGTGLLLGGSAARLVDGPGRDDQGFIMGSSQTWWSPGYAVHSQSTDIHGDTTLVDLPDWVLGTVTATVDPATDDDVFIGLARTTDVNRYLRGVAHTTIVDPPGNHRDHMMPMTTFEDGGPPSVAPTAADFWQTSASGLGRQTITWEPENGSWTLVVMRSDGTEPVAADVAVGAEVPALGAVGTTLIIVGAVTIMLAGVGLWLARRRT